MKFLSGVMVGAVLCLCLMYVIKKNSEVAFFHDDHKAKVSVIIGYDPSLTVPVQEEVLLVQDPKAATQQHRLRERKVITIRDLDLFLAVREVFLRFRVAAPSSEPPGK